MLFNHLLCLVFRPIFELMTTSCVCSDQLNSLELDHVQVVERHEMPVSAEHVHETLRIYHCAVPITGSRSLSVNKSKLGGLSVGRCVLVRVAGAKVPSLSLSHLLVVSIEALVSILDQECVLHGNGGGGGEAVLLLAVRFTSVLLAGR